MAFIDVPQVIFNQVSLDSSKVSQGGVSVLRVVEGWLIVSEVFPDGCMLPIVGSNKS